MNKFLLAVKNSGWMIISIFLLTSVWSCQDDFEENEESLNQLKNGVACVEPSGTFGSGALYEIELPGMDISPAIWNSLPQKNLIIYAHGYRDFNKPLALPIGGTDQVEGVPIKDIVLNQLVAGWATTSYRRNGLVVKDAIEDLKELRETIDDFFECSDFDSPDYIYLIGPSEGSLITALAIEKYPNDYDGAMGTCGPIGNFYRQLQYFGDALLLFKYFFFESFEIPIAVSPFVKVVNLGTPNNIPLETIAAWDQDIGHPDGLTYLQAKIVEALQTDLITNQGKNIIQFLKCSKIPVDLTGLATDPIAQEAIGKAILEVLRFSIKGSMDAKFVLNGCPYNNLKKYYFGSCNDRKLNKTIERLKGDNWYAAKKEVILNYHPKGDIEIPFVTLHTTGDHVALYWHEMIYSYKIWKNRSFRFYAHIPVKRYGHCNFTLDEVMKGLAILQYKTTKQAPLLPLTADLPSGDLKNLMDQLMQKYCK